MSSCHSITSKPSLLKTRRKILDGYTLHIASLHLFQWYAHVVAGNNALFSGVHRACHPPVLVIMSDSEQVTFPEAQFVSPLRSVVVLGNTDRINGTGQCRRLWVQQCRLQKLKYNVNISVIGQGVKFGDWMNFSKDCKLKCQF